MIFVYKPYKENLSPVVNKKTIVPKTSSSNNKDSNMIFYGLKNLNNEIIDNGSSLNGYIHNNELNVIVSLQHLMNEEREYGLIVLENYKQTEFKIINNEKIDKFLFTMKANSEKDIKVMVPISKDAIDIAFLIIKKPSYELREKDLTKAGILEEVLSLRFPLKKDTEKKQINNAVPNEVLKTQINESLFLSKKEKVLQFIEADKEQSNLFLSVGNDQKYPIQYAIIALNNWEQVPSIDNKEEVFYSSVVPNKRNIYNFKIPKVTKDTNFQFIAFPYPYQVSSKNYKSQQAIGSFRILILNND